MVSRQPKELVAHVVLRCSESAKHNADHDVNLLTLMGRIREIDEYSKLKTNGRKSAEEKEDD